MDVADTVAPRPPLSALELRRDLVRPGRLWRDVRVVAETGSTNADLLAAAAGGAAEGAVLAAEVQTAGRGRLGRQWVAPPRAALTFSVLLRPAAVPPARRGWLPLLVGVAVAGALRGDAGVDAWLKWPNDILVGGGKVAGILAEQSGDAIVVGVGINVSSRAEELPSAGATSLALAGAACADRQRLLVGLLASLERWYLRWAGAEAAGAGATAPGDAAACGLRQEYRRRCATLGREVRIALPGGATLTGTASDVDELGRLVVVGPSGPVAVSAGDVIHVR
jgi:BirA family transcriptional regulator, biotin operon repressor / biotin---[acetyl-CoA-carboxylase] ligase